MTRVPWIVALTLCGCAAPPDDTDPLQQGSATRFLTGAQRGRVRASAAEQTVPVSRGSRGTQRIPERMVVFHGESAYPAGAGTSGSN